MDVILQGLTPIITAGIETTIIPIIKQNLEKLDTIEGDINQKLDDIANKAKTDIDSLPVIPFIFTKEIKEKLLKEIPFDKVDKLLDEIDLSAIEKIEIKPIIDNGVDKSLEIKAKLTQFPNKIREKLKASIRAAFLPGAVADNTQVIKTNTEAATTTDTAATTTDTAATTTDTAATTTDTAATTTDTAATTTDTAAAAATTTDIAAATNVSTATDIAAATNVSTATDTTKTIDAAKAGLAGLNSDEKNETINKIIKMLKETGVLDLIKPQLSSNPPVPPVPPVPPAPAGGGAKKRRRKTKKNIRRNKNAKTRFGRTF